MLSVDSNFIYCLCHQELREKHKQNQILRAEDAKEQVLQELRRNSCGKENLMLIEMERCRQIAEFKNRTRNTDFLEVDRKLLDVQDQLVNLFKKLKV